MTWVAMISAFLGTLLSLAQTKADVCSQQVSLQSPDHIALGSTPLRVQIDVLVTKGFHVQANPASREGLIPTEIQFEPNTLFQFSGFTYPKGVPLRLTQGAGEILTYSGNFPVSFQLARTAQAAKERKLVKGLIHYQACDDHVCMRPSSAAFEFWVESPK